MIFLPNLEAGEICTRPSWIRKLGRVVRLQLRKKAFGFFNPRRRVWTERPLFSLTFWAFAFFIVVALEPSYPCSNGASPLLTRIRFEP
ncbi:hypothetical protein F8388_010184 [Cannabis sativa]|uniref:Uncharacterized protein n=1 Tax=Cannabis sativa TaxID=3483 RepID=A0A7J6GS81_CANSA|nr:hypothetical protein F8388_010184 [Cannabis sativa]